MKTYKIKASIATHHQLNALKHFHLGMIPRRDGSFYGEKEFDSFEDAQDYLTEIAEIYYTTNEQIADNLGDDYLIIDRCTARIIEVEFFIIAIRSVSGLLGYWMGEDKPLTRLNWEALRYTSKDIANDEIANVVRPYINNSEDFSHYSYIILLK